MLHSKNLYTHKKDQCENDEKYNNLDEWIKTILKNKLK